MDLTALFPLRLEADAEGVRLDAFLAKHFPQVSRSRWAKVIKDGAFTIDGHAALPASVLKSGQVLEFSQGDVPVREAPSTLAALREKPSFAGPEPELLFEDSHVLVIHKPEGLSVHPGHGTPLEKTLVAWLLANNKIDWKGEGLLRWGSELIEAARPGIVHRLDRVTSGLMVVAKNPAAHAQLAKQFADRRAGRHYDAVVVGRLEKLRTARPRPLCRLSENPVGHWRIESTLVRDERERTRFANARSLAEQARGKLAATQLHEVAAGPDFTRVELKLETGRTHQIRVHLSGLGFPILGDGLYGGRGHTRVMLHAHALHFEHPADGSPRDFHAPWPESDRLWLAAQKLI